MKTDYKLSDEEYFYLESSIPENQKVLNNIANSEKAVEDWIKLEKGNITKCHIGVNGKLDMIAEFLETVNKIFDEKFDN